MEIKYKFNGKLEYKVNGKLELTSANKANSLKIPLLQKDAEFNWLLESKTQRLKLKADKLKSYLSALKNIGESYKNDLSDITESSKTEILKKYPFLAEEKIFDLNFYINSLNKVSQPDFSFDYEIEKIPDNKISLIIRKSEKSPSSDYQNILSILRNSCLQEITIICFSHVDREIYLNLELDSDNLKKSINNEIFISGFYTTKTTEDSIGVTDTSTDDPVTGAESTSVAHPEPRPQFPVYPKRSIPTDETEIPYPHQYIFSGAPGTGKSFRLNQLAQAEEFSGENGEVARITFYPNYMTGQFIGQYKPVPKRNSVGEEYISYEYVPGVLLKLLLKALQNPDKNYLLIIEEINRAQAASVFADYFQLLDRRAEDSNNSNLDSGEEDLGTPLFTAGSSEYDLALPEDLKSFLDNPHNINLNGIDPSALTQTVRKRLGYTDPDGFEKIYFPENFYIWATMNSADQGVFPLDTAFKRRWEFHYVALDEASPEDDKYYFSRGKDDPQEKVEWNSYRQALNKLLARHNVPEDKLLGGYFISRSVLNKAAENPTGEDYLFKTIKDKVVRYIFEDAARQSRASIFRENSTIFSEVASKWEKDVIEAFNFNDSEKALIKKK